MVKHCIAANTIVGPDHCAASIVVMVTLVHECSRLREVRGQLTVEEVALALRLAGEFHLWARTRIKSPISFDDMRSVVRKQVGDLVGRLLLLTKHVTEDAKSVLFADLTDGRNLLCFDQAVV